MCSSFVEFCLGSVPFWAAYGANGMGRLDEPNPNTKNDRNAISARIAAQEVSVSSDACDLWRAQF